MGGPEAVAFEDSLDHHYVDVSRPVHPEIELLLDVAGATGSADYDQIRRVLHSLQTFVSPMSQGSFQSCHLQKRYVDIRHETCHPRPAAAVAENNTSTLGKTGYGAGHTKIKVVIGQLMFESAFGGDLTADPGESSRGES